MTKVLWRALAIGALALSASVARGADDPAAPTNADQAQPTHVAGWHDKGTREDRWENGLDAKLTSLFNRKGADVTSPTLIMSAQWNYRFPSDTYVGFSASGMPTSNNDSDSDGVRRDFSTYYGGIDVIQGVFDSGRFHVLASLMAGKGIVYVRYQTSDPNGDIGKATFYVVEPTAYLLFYEWGSMDVGALASYRSVSLEKTDRASNSDLSSLSLGATFRVRSW